MKNELGRKCRKTCYGKLSPLILQPTLQDVTMYTLLIQRRFTFPSWLSTYPSCFHFIPRGAAPSFPIRKNFTFLSLKTWLHMTPPFLFHYGSYRQKNRCNVFCWVCSFSGCTFKEKAINFSYNWLDCVLDFRVCLAFFPPKRLNLDFLSRIIILILLYSGKNTLHETYPFESLNIQCTISTLLNDFPWEYIGLMKTDIFERN